MFNNWKWILWVRDQSSDGVALLSSNITSPRKEMESEINSIFYIKDKSIFHLDTNDLYVSPFETFENEGNPELKFKSCSFQCFRVFHRFLYYTFTYPYKLVVDTNERKVYFVSNGIRTVIDLFSKFACGNARDFE